MSSSLTALSARAMAAGVRCGEFSALELVEAHLAQIANLNGRLGAIVALDGERARARARTADAARSRDIPLGPLHGVPFTVKDAIAVAGLPSRDASLLCPSRVDPHDAPVVRRMRAAGAIPLAKTNMSELALFPDSTNLVHGATRNPHDLTRSAGGSSGGEAAAVAAGLSPLGIGADYGGSIRCPAHFCGIAGLRAGLDSIPDGGAPMAGAPGRTALSTTGPLAREVGDLQQALAALTGAPLAAAPPRRVVIAPDATAPPIESACARAVEHAAATFRARGLTVEIGEPPVRAQAARCFDLLSAAETHALLARWLPKRLNDASPQLALQWRALEANPPAPADGALAALGELARSADAWLAEQGPWLAPAAATPAFELGALEGIFERFEHCKLASALGLPAVVLPVLRDESGLPVGVQLTGRRGRDGELLALARELEAGLLDAC